MEYLRPPLTFEEQADLLIQRGLVADRNLLIAKLRAVNYYRLNGYLHPFRVGGGDSFKPGTTLEMIWRRYTFDRRLRLLVMDAIERIEVTVRTNLAYHFAHQCGPFAYTSHASLPHIGKQQHCDWLDRLKGEIDRSKEGFVTQFVTQYGDKHPFPPVWIMVEIMPLGATVTFFRGVENAIRSNIAGELDVPGKVLDSWMLSLNTVRNVCAHHGRLWNRRWGTGVLLPGKNKHPHWHSPILIPRNRTFTILTICRYLLGYIAPQSNWSGRLADLFAEYEDVPRTPMGFPENWGENPLWQGHGRDDVAGE